MALHSILIHPSRPSLCRHRKSSPTFAAHTTYIYCANGTNCERRYVFVWLLPCMNLQHSTGVPLQLLRLDDALESGCLQSRTSVPRQGDSLNIVNVQIIACTYPR